MFKWLKTLFSHEPEEILGIDKPKVTPTIEETKPEPTQAKKTQSAQKEPTKSESPKQRGRKKTGVTKTDLNKMTKDELEAYAKKEHGVDLDKRRKKADLVAEVLKLAK